MLNIGTLCSPCPSRNRGYTARASVSSYADSDHDTEFGERLVHGTGYDVVSDG
jgi:hypothetical protein